MKAVIWNWRTKLFFKGAGQWCETAAEALDFGETTLGWFAAERLDEKQTLQVLKIEDASATAAVPLGFRLNPRLQSRQPSAQR